MHRKKFVRQNRSFADWPNQLAYSKVIFTYQKSFSKTSTTLLFWRTKFFLRTFHTRYAYKKQYLGSNESLSTNQSIIRHVKVIILQERAIFVGFKEIISWPSQESISIFQKSFFQTSTRLRFWRAEFFLHIFYPCYAYEKYSIGSKESPSINQNIIRQVEMTM